jgi:hypothetical protein
MSDRPARTVHKYIMMEIIEDDMAKLKMIGGPRGITGGGMIIVGKVMRRRDPHGSKSTTT